MKKFILMMIGLLCLGIGSAFAESKTNEDIIKINSTYTIKKGSLRTPNEGSVSIKTLEDTQGFEWKDVLKKYYSRGISNNTYAWYKNRKSDERIATLNIKDGTWKLTITNSYPKEMTGYLIDFNDYSIKYGIYDYYAIKKDLKTFYTLVYDLRNNPCILKIDNGKLYSYDETNLKEKIIKDLFYLADLYSYNNSYSYYINKGYSESDSVRLAKKDNNEYNFKNWKWESFLDKDEYFGYVINFLNYTIVPAILKKDDDINGRFYFQTKDGVFSASNWIEGKKDSKWEIKKSDKSLKDYMLSYISWRCEYKDAEKEYEKVYNEELNFCKNEESATFFAKSHMNRIIEDNKEVPYWIEVQNKILEFFEETN